MNTLFLDNDTQAALFKFEIVGQLSDGNWENLRPHDHWKVWCRCNTAIASNDISAGRNFYVARDNYGLTSPKLLYVIGGRMIGYARLVQKFGFIAADELQSCVDIGEYGEYQPRFKDPLAFASNDDYWKEKAAQLKKYDMDKVKECIEHGNYNKRNLICDLKRIKAAMQNHVETPDPIVKPKSIEPKRFYGHTSLANEVARITSLNVRLENSSDSNVLNAGSPYAWYTLVTKTGMVVANFETRSDNNETWAIVGKSIPFPDPVVWEKISQLGL